MSGRTVINGGTFISDGYAIQHFDHSTSVNETNWMEFPKINGGIFSGSVGYIGMSFVYENYDTTGYGVKEYREKAAADIINNNALVRYIKNGKMYDDLEDLTLGDLHEGSSLYVISDSLFDFDTLPAVTGDTTELERDVVQTNMFKVLYEVPYGMNDNFIEPYISVIPNGGTETTWVTTEKTIAYADYPDGLTVKAGIAMNFAGEVFTCENTYVITVTDEPKPAHIVSQPTSCEVSPGEYAEATVIANYAKSYQWYIYLEGYPIPLTDNLATQLSGVKIEGYTTPTLRIAADSVLKGEFHCVVTGTDDSTTKTNRISFTFGGIPSVTDAGGGEYYENGDAEFVLWADYAEEVTWYVIKRISGSLNIYTLDEFAELTECEYVTSHKGIGFYDELYKATVTFKNVPASWSGTYSVGYRLMNDLGEVSFNPENTIPFKLTTKKPLVTQLIETQSCKEGESVTYTFEAEDMSAADWIFEKADEEGIMFTYTLDDMRALFPEVSFETSLAEGKATLTISNVNSALCEYIIYANAVGVSAYASAGVAQLNIWGTDMGVGYTISGTVKSFNDGTASIELLKDGEVADFMDSNNSYSFSGMAEGTYTLKVSKSKHATREYEITVTGNTTQNVEIWLYGDVTKDGLVNNADTIQINRRNANLTSVFSQVADSDYRFKVANVTAVAGTDTIINNADIIQINRMNANLNSVFDRIA